MDELLERIETKYASAERVDEEEVNYQHELVDSFLIVKPFIDDVDHIFLILNRYRQIIYANKLFFKLIQSDNSLGQRLGESFKCIHSLEEFGGCGTSESCANCAGVNTVLNSQQNGIDQQEFRITSENSNVYDLNIWAKNIKIENSDYTLVSITDISSDKRRQVLERLFFHDVLNTAGSLKNFLELMQDSTPEEMEELSKLTLDVSSTLIDELKSQRMLSLAEDSKLEIDVTEFNAEDVFNDVLCTYQNNYIGEFKTLKLIEGESNNITIKSDRILLRRVLGNLAKNALEASDDGGKVSLSINELNSKIIFNVHKSEY
ncbi:MAG: hypothetical protein L3J42_02425 [Hydrogenimonas sp.]|nr:hypothetical protein [Hydrogenimonas sp.]